jgi:hypothetical protein
LHIAAPFVQPLAVPEQHHEAKIHVHLLMAVKERDARMVRKNSASKLILQMCSVKSALPSWLPPFAAAEQATAPAVFKKCCQFKGGLSHTASDAEPKQKQRGCKTKPQALSLHNQQGAAAGHSLQKNVPPQQLCSCRTPGYCSMR